MLVLLDCAQEDLSYYLSVFVFLYYFLYGFCIFLPHFEGDEGRVCEDEIEVVVVFLGDKFGMVEIVLEEIGVVVTEFGIVLGGGIEYVEEEEGSFVLGVIDGVVDGGG